MCNEIWVSYELYLGGFVYPANTHSLMEDNVKGAFSSSKMPRIKIQPMNILDINNLGGLSSIIYSWLEKYIDCLKRLCSKLLTQQIE